MDTSFVHGAIVSLCIASLIILGKVMGKISKNEFILFMIVQFIALTMNIMIFSIFRLLEEIVLIFPNVFYNYWSLFIIVQAIMGGLIIGIMALRKLEGK